MSGPLRVGILSTANIARAAVVPALRACPDTDVVAVASRDAERARAFAADSGIARAVEGYEALLCDDGVDAVYIGLPNALHEAWTIRALEAGKHVLCEKPLAPTAAACARMGRSAQQADRVLMEAFMYRFHPRVRAAERLVRAGGLGRLAVVDATFTFEVRDPSNIRLSADLAGGALLDVGCYTVDVARRLVGEPVTAVSAFARWDGPDGVDLETVGLLRFAGGAHATVRSALTLPRRESVTVVGDEATARLDRAFLPGVDETELRIERSGADPDVRVVPGKDPYLAMVEAFVGRVRGGVEAEDAPASDAAEAAGTVRVLEALARSARQGGGVVAVDAPSAA